MRCMQPRYLSKVGFAPFTETNSIWELVFNVYVNLLEIALGLRIHVGALQPTTNRVFLRLLHMVHAMQVLPTGLGPSQPKLFTTPI